MANSLDETKKLLAQRYLGKGGVHGFGISRAQQAIRVYVSPELQQADVLEELRQSAAPYDVIVVHEEPPRIARPKS